MGSQFMIVMSVLALPEHVELFERGLARGGRQLAAAVAARVEEERDG